MKTNQSWVSEKELQARATNQIGECYNMYIREEKGQKLDC